MICSDKRLVGMCGATYHRTTLIWVVIDRVVGAINPTHEHIRNGVRVRNTIDHGSIFVLQKRY